LWQKSGAFNDVAHVEANGGVVMKPISFVARGGTGSVDRGNVSADQNFTAIQASAGGEYSFNLRQSDIVRYGRAGTNLEITLADGRVILLENFFDGSGTPVAKLYVSADTYISEVTLVDGANGELYGQYGVAETWGKYGAGDDLIFVDGTEVAHAAMGQEEEVSMLGAVGLLGGLGGVGTAAAVAGGIGVLGGVAGGGGGGGGTPVYVEPTVNDATVVIGGDDVTEADQVVEVTGTAQPGSQVVVTIGEEVVTVVSDANGDWSATFAGETFPADGGYAAGVVITEPNGTVTGLEGPSVTVDLTGPAINLADGVQSTGDLVTSADYSDGVEISGTGEAGAALTVTIGSVTHETVVGEDGSWSVTFSTSEVEGGEYETDVTIVSTDSYGNSTTTVETLVVDTISNVTFGGANGGADGVINGAEHGGGVTLTGTTQPGSSVVVTLDGVQHNATVDAQGNWTVRYSSSEVRTGDYTGNVSVTATDAVGNSSSTTGTVEFDTLVENYTINTTTGGGDNVVSASEALNGVNFGGTVEPGSTVMVNFAGIDRAANVAANGSWTVSYSAGEIPQSNGSTFTMTAVATDGAGNSSTLTQGVVVDNMAGSLTLSSAPIETDNIINAAEAADGVVVRGTSDAGNLVQVQMGTATVNVVTDASGNWTANFGASQIAGGQYTAPITATTTDAAGNSRTVTGSVEVDTEVRNLGVSVDNVTTDNVINGAERDDGVTFSGTTEAGSTSVVVTIDGVSRNATVNSAGSWSVTFPKNDLPDAEDTYQLQVAVTDRAGNTATASRDVEFDTFVNALSGGAVQEGSNTVFNASEIRDGITVSGQVEAGSTVTVDFGGATYNATVDANGNWTLDLPASAFSAEEYSADLVVNARDAAGNVDSLTQTIEIDAALPDTPEIFAETSVDDGYAAVWVQDSVDTQAVYEVAQDNSVTLIADENGAARVGGNNVFGFDETVPDGSHLVVSATDAAGNVSSTFMALDDPGNSNIDMSSVNTGLAGLEIEAIDLTFAEDTNLTLSLNQIEAFAENSTTLAIHGGDDDTVNITGAVKTTATVSEGGQTYDVYTIGDDHTVLIDDDITVVI
jgi:hypothetical protein